MHANPFGNGILGQVREVLPSVQAPGGGEYLITNHEAAKYATPRVTGESKVMEFLKKEFFGVPVWAWLIIGYFAFIKR
ncbi:hypothetical protein DRP77_13575 [Candidatus Poribacteria bacterium]|nr:MAG: hypothetical protein DRP77_13575 [Candidatus Poribacteria bacterium]